MPAPVCVFRFQRATVAGETAQRILQTLRKFFDYSFFSVEHTAQTWHRFGKEIANNLISHPVPVRVLPKPEETELSIKEQISDAIKHAMRAKDQARLDCLRMGKGALLLKEKESSKELTEDIEIAILRSEVKKRQQSMETFADLGKTDAVEATRREIEILESFLPQQLSEEALEEKVRAYLADHPEIDHAGRLTGAIKKELGDAADGKMLNAVCQKALSQ